MPITDSNVVTAKCECGKEVATVLSPQTVSSIRTVKCDAEGCTHEITYDRRAEQATINDPANAWMKSVRTIQSVDGRQMVYCSDLCEVSGTKTGKHNIPEAPMVQPGNASAVAAAVAAAKARQEADANIRAGRPANVTLTDGQ